MAQVCELLQITEVYGLNGALWNTPYVLKLRHLTSKFSIFLNLWAQHVQVGYRESHRWSRREGEGTDRLTDNPTLPHGAASKLTFCLSPAWLVAVCLRGSHYESTLAWSSQQSTRLSSVVHTSTPTALLLHLLRCGEKTSQVTGNCRSRGLIRSEVQIKWERSYPIECPSQWWEN